MGQTLRLTNGFPHRITYTTLNFERLPRSAQLLSTHRNRLKADGGSSCPHHPKCWLPRDADLLADDNKIRIEAGIDLKDRAYTRVETVGNTVQGIAGHHRV